MHVKRPEHSLYWKETVMSYVLAVITSFNSSDTKEVTLKARGLAMTTSVDVAEILPLVDVARKNNVLRLVFILDNYLNRC